jgi:hypothetical protein
MSVILPVHIYLVTSRVDCLPHSGYRRLIVVQSNPAAARRIHGRPSP